MGPTYLKERGYRFFTWSREEERKHIHIIKIIIDNETDFKQQWDQHKVNAVVSNGILLEVLGKDFFLSYNANPWFQNARISDIFNVEMVGKTGIRWDNLDVDLAIDSLIYPEKYPLVAKY